MPLLLNMVKSIFQLALTSMNSMKESKEKRRTLLLKPEIIQLI